MLAFFKINNFDLIKQKESSRYPADQENETQKQIFFRPFFKLFSGVVWIINYNSWLIILPTYANKTISKKVVKNLKKKYIYTNIYIKHLKLCSSKQCVLKFKNNSLSKSLKNFILKTKKIKNLRFINKIFFKKLKQTLKKIPRIFKKRLFKKKKFVIKLNKYSKFELQERKTIIVKNLNRKKIFYLKTKKKTLITWKKPIFKKWNYSFHFFNKKV